MTLAPRTRSAHAPRRTLLASTLLVAIALAGCGGTPAASSAPSEGAPSPAASAAPSTAVSTEPSAAPSTAAPSSAAPAPSEAAVCLPAEILAAIEEIKNGNLEPDVPLGEIADAVAALDVSGLDVPFAQADVDDLVEKLRADPEGDFYGATLRVAADVFLTDLEEHVQAC